MIAEPARDSMRFRTCVPRAQVFRHAPYHPTYGEAGYGEGYQTEAKLGAHNKKEAMRDWQGGMTGAHELRVGDAASLAFVLCGKCGLPITTTGMGTHARSCIGSRPPSPLELSRKQLRRGRRGAGSEARGCIPGQKQRGSRWKQTRGRKLLVRLPPPSYSSKRQKQNGVAIGQPGKLHAGK